MSGPMKILILLVVVCGHAAAQEPAPETLRLGVLYWSMSIPGQVAMRTGFEAEIKAANEARAAAGSDAKGPRIELEVRVAGDGPEGIERQIEQMRELIAARVDMIVIQPTDNAALAKPLLEANKAGIPVIAYDQYVAKGELACYLTSDNYQAGFLAGEYAASRFPEKSAIKLVLVEYPHVSSTVERVNGFLDALKAAHPETRILRSYLAVEPKSGREAGQAILKDFPEKDSIDLIFTVNDGGGLAVVDQLAGAGRDEILVATVDGDERSIENIRKKRLTIVDCAQFCGALGRETAKIAVKLARKERIPKQVRVPVFPITPETLDLFHGWNKELPKSFKKSWPSKTPTWDYRLQLDWE